MGALTSHHRPFTFSGATTGLALGDFMIGRAQTFAQGNRIFIHDRSTYVGLYAQDAGPLAQRLTINAGLRWEPYLPFVELNGQFSTSMSNSGGTACAALCTGTRRWA